MAIVVTCDDMQLIEHVKEMKEKTGLSWRQISQWMNRGVSYVNAAINHPEENLFEPVKKDLREWLDYQQKKLDVATLAEPHPDAYQRALSKIILGILSDRLDDTIQDVLEELDVQDEISCTLSLTVSAIGGEA